MGKKKQIRSHSSGILSQTLSNIYTKSNVYMVREVLKMAKSKPKKDGSGGGTRANKGRGGCPSPKQPSKGKGSNK